MVKGNCGLEATASLAGLSPRHLSLRTSDFRLPTSGDGVHPSTVSIARRSIIVSRSASSAPGSRPSGRCSGVLPSDCKAPENSIPPVAGATAITDRRSAPSPHESTSAAPWRPFWTAASTGAGHPLATRVAASRRVRSAGESEVSGAPIARRAVPMRRDSGEPPVSRAMRARIDALFQAQKSTPRTRTWIRRMVRLSDGTWKLYICVQSPLRPEMRSSTG